jgi:uncharacterized phage-like protein YoqJ
MLRARCAFSGQDLNTFPWGFDEKDDRCLKLKITLLQEIEVLYNKGIHNFITDCAPGVSTWSAEFVIGMMERHQAIQLKCVIFEHSPKWLREYRTRFSFLLNHCTEIVNLGLEYHENYFHACSQYLVDNSDILVAVSDMNECRQNNPGYIVRYAQQLNHDVIRIHPVTLAITAPENYR